MDSPTNQLFPVFTDEQLEALEENFIFSPWERVNDSSTAVRVCTSWCTPDSHVDALIKAIKELKK